MNARLRLRAERAERAEEEARELREMRELSIRLQALEASMACGHAPPPPPPAENPHLL